MGNCDRCAGSGRIPDLLGGGFGGEPCSDCGGTGSIVTQASSSQLDLPDQDKYIYQVSISASSSFQLMIKSGKYYSVNPIITTLYQREPRPRPGNYELQVINHGYSITTDGAITKMRANDLEPAGIWFLAALGEQYPKLRILNCIAAVDCVYLDKYNDPLSPAMYFVAGRSLGMFSSENYKVWGQGDCFLAVAK